MLTDLPHHVGEVDINANISFYFFVNKFLCCNVFCKFARINEFIRVFADKCLALLTP